MKKWLVKETSVATEQNPNFAGKVTVGYFGKGDECLKLEGCGWEDYDHIRHMLEEYGYNREADARRNWTYRNPENTEYWKSTVEIVEVKA